MSSYWLAQFRFAQKNPKSGWLSERGWRGYQPFVDNIIIIFMPIDDSGLIPRVTFVT